MSAILSVTDLVKHYKGVRAVDGVSFAIDAGRCFGLLGPNGAGKTTTVEMLEGIKTPDSGRILYKGEPLSARFKNEAGIMFQSTALQEFVTVRETLNMFRQLYPAAVPSDELIETCALQEFLNRDTRRLSGGQRQRLLLAVALVNDPDILFLDEPTTGLDPQSRHNFWELITGIKRRGKTVVLTTHYMEEAYTLCDTIAIMDHGRIIAEGSPGRLLATHFTDTVVQLPRADLPPDLATLPFAVTEREGLGEIASADLDTTIAQLQAHRVPLARMSIRRHTLEDLFLAITGREVRS